MTTKYDRQIKFFGSENQQKLSNMTIAIVGLGGIGSHIVQQLAFLGVNNYVLVDDDKLDETNKNRLIGVYDTDNNRKPKVEISERLIRTVNSKACPISIKKSVISGEAFEAVRETDFIFGCVDNDGARHCLNEIALAYNTSYIDCASEIDPDSLEFGGRVFYLIENGPCLYCIDELDPEEVRLFLEHEEARKDQEYVYGIKKRDLKEGGPAVVSLNGVVASIAVNEFLVSITDIRKPKKYLTYYGSRGIVTERISKPQEDCYYCNNVKGKGLDFKSYVR